MKRNYEVKYSLDDYSDDEKQEFEAIRDTILDAAEDFVTTLPVEAPLRCVSSIDYLKLRSITFLYIMELKKACLNPNLNGLQQAKKTAFLCNAIARRKPLSIRIEHEKGEPIPPSLAELAYEINADFATAVFISLIDANLEKFEESALFPIIRDGIYKGFARENSCEVHLQTISNIVSTLFPEEDTDLS